MKRPFFYLLICVFPFILWTTGCQTSPSDDAPKQLRLIEVTHSPFYAPQYVAIEKDFFEKVGIDLELSEGFGGDKTMASLLSGDADIALIGAETAVYVTARGATNPVVAFGQLTQTDGSYLVGRQPQPHFQWKNLKGRTLLGQRQGGMPQMVSEHVQRKHDLIPHQDVKIIQNIDFKNVASAFLSGTGDYVQLFEPIASKIEQERKGHIVASFGQESGHLPYTVYLAREDKIKENPALIKNYLRALYQAQLWCQYHSPKEIANVIAPFFPDTKLSLLEKVVARYQKQQAWAPNPIIDKTEYSHLLDVMKKAGELPRSVPYSNVINRQYADDVVQEKTK